MIRKINKQDREAYLDMVKEFYSSDAVLHNVNEQNFIVTFEELLCSDVYTECYIFEINNDIAGYALLSKTFSQEAGGIVVWIEEIFVKPEFRGKGFGKEFFSFIDTNIRPKVKRLRLEIEPYNTRAIDLYRKVGFTDLEYNQMYIDCN